MATINTAQAIHRENELGTLAVGRTAEVSVLRIAVVIVPDAANMMPTFVARKA